MVRQEKEKKGIGWLFRMTSLGLSVLLLGFALFGRDGFLAVVMNRERLYKLRYEIDFLKVENKRLQGRIHSLKNDLRSIERIAREDLGFVLPGETVYEFIYESENFSVVNGTGDTREKGGKVRIQN